MAAARVIAIAPDRYEGYFLKALGLDPLPASPSRPWPFSSVQFPSPRTTPARSSSCALIEKNNGNEASARQSVQAALRVDPANKPALHMAAAFASTNTTPAATFASHPAAAE